MIFFYFLVFSMEEIFFEWRGRKNFTKNKRRWRTFTHKKWRASHHINQLIFQLLTHIKCFSFYFLFYYQADRIVELSYQFEILVYTLPFVPNMGTFFFFLFLYFIYMHTHRENIFGTDIYPYRPGFLAMVFHR